MSVLGSCAGWDKHNYMYLAWIDLLLSTTSFLPPGLLRKSPPPTPNSPELELQSPVAVSKKPIPSAKKPIPSANTSFELFKKQAMENAERVGVVSHRGSSFMY